MALFDPLLSRVSFGVRLTLDEQGLRERSEASRSILRDIRKLCPAALS
jgi:hypothetical protein